ncbi:MAG TPA: copper homeostasis protein CutC [Candidatus Acidoferrum sp.]|jgi:copper homeostasis protein
MNKSIVLEICVETLAAAVAAERGGADRIELCEELLAGGVTPRAELMRAVREQVKVPVFAMIRPRSGDFHFSDAEFEQMKREIEAAKAAGMNGVVFGILQRDGAVDVQRTTELVRFAQPLPVTFHRAFDELPDLLDGLEDVIATGAARILTSGGKPHVEQGIAAIATLVSASGGRIEIVAGGGIRAENLERLLRRTQVREVHAGLGTVLPYPRADHEQFEVEVRRLAEILNREHVKTTNKY